MTANKLNLNPSKTDMLQLGTRSGPGIGVSLVLDGVALHLKEALLDLSNVTF